MNQKAKKEKLDVRITVRFTLGEAKLVNETADELGMQASTYIRDRIVNGRERSNYSKRKLCTTLVTMNQYLDQFQDTVLSMDGDSIPKEELIPFIEKLRKECELK